MSLFEKDYNQLSDKENQIIQEYKKLEPDLLAMINGSKIVDPKVQYLKQAELIRDNLFILNHESIFPNNFLNEIDLKVNSYDHINKLQNFKKLLNDKSITERNILNFIRDEKAYFIIGSVLKNYTIYGHHDRYIFQEFMLPPDFKADFLVVGKNSDGYHFLFFELENPYKNITKKDGNFGETIRKGIEQIDSWKGWMDKNFSGLKNVFNKHKNHLRELPMEFLEFDSTRFNYVVIAGRREDFNEKTYSLRRKNLKDNLTVLHYDNLIDESLKLIKSGSY
jgi:hypothetical protein